MDTPEAGRQTQMRYMRSVSFIFENPRWWLVPLIGLLAMMVPVLGMIVYIGYLGELLEKTHLSGDDSYDDFDFNRLGPYLSRGVWPFLAMMVVSIVVSIPLFMVIVIGVPLSFGIASSVGGEMGQVLGLLCGCLVTVVYLGLIVVLTLITQPIMLGALLSQDFGAAFSYPFIKDFIRKVWREMIGAIFFMWAISLCACVIGMLMCFIGIYFMIGPLMLMQFHLLGQIYEVHLSRGGMAIQLKETA